MAEWDKYEDRYASRPGTFDAYVDVWNRLPEAQQMFTGWSSFSQAANAEPAQDPDRVRLAERLMVDAGYQIGTPTPRGGRQWESAASARGAGNQWVDKPLDNGIRGINIRHGDGAETRIDRAQYVEVYFGPHHLLRVEERGDRTVFAIVTTHHGVVLDASEIGGELETTIERLRELLPHNAID